MASQGQTTGHTAHCKRFSVRAFALADRPPRSRPAQGVTLDCFGQFGVGEVRVGSRASDKGVLGTGLAG